MADEQQPDESQEDARYVIVGAVQRVTARVVSSELMEPPLPGDDQDRKKTVPPNMRIDTRVMERAGKGPARKKGRTMSDIFPR
ncbi:MAG: hypothetical protein AMXMBFR64_12290 [Myxococcales bacterium]